jgi:phosphoethanolamine N-methyltransferase
VTQEPEYHDAMISMLELVWGPDFMAPGGEGNVDNLVRGLEVRDRRVLDIGCGLGGPAFVLAQKYGALVVGIDIDARLIEHAKRRAGELGLSARATFRAVDPGPLPFDDEGFDIVLISGALTQVEDKRGTLAECLRVLRPGGWFTCYDWMRGVDGEYSEDMRYWFELEGLTYAMATPERQLSIMREVGFDQLAGHGGRLREGRDAAGLQSRAEARLKTERVPSTSAIREGRGGRTGGGR